MTQKILRLMFLFFETVTTAYTHSIIHTYKRLAGPQHSAQTLPKHRNAIIVNQKVLICMFSVDPLCLQINETMAYNVSQPGLIYMSLHI